MSTDTISPQLYEQLSHVCDAVELTTSQGHPVLRFAGKNIDTSADDTYSTAAERQTCDSLTLALRNTLYRHCYAYSLLSPVARKAASESPTLRSPGTQHTDDVTPQLSAANRGTARWEPDWTIRTVTADGQYVAVKNNTRRSVWPGEFISAQGTGQPVYPGSSVYIHHPHEATHWQPGFYYAFSNAHHHEFDVIPLVRFYWNVRVEEAAALVSQITTQFNHYQMPFRFKCTNQCSLSERIDTAVLYVPESHFRLTLQLVIDIHQHIEQTLNERVPLFTCPIAKGLSFAQDPPGDNSFGMDRCLRLARALLHCLSDSENSTSTTTTDSLCTQLITQLQREGLDISKPHITGNRQDILSTQFKEHLHASQH